MTPLDVSKSREFEEKVRLVISSLRVPLTTGDWPGKYSLKVKLVQCCFRNLKVAPKESSQCSAENYLEPIGDFPNYGAIIHVPNAMPVEAAQRNEARRMLQRKCN